MGAEQDITAVVSLYNPDSGVVDHCAALLQQVGHVVAVDDGSDVSSAPILAQIESLGCQLVRKHQNSGIASALNAGMQAARTEPQNPKFILTMDQDSLLEVGYTSKLISAHDTAVAAGIPVGMIGPGSISGLPTRRISEENAVVIGGEPIQSGLLIPCTVLDQIGYLMDELFIDGVDTEFYLRARRVGLHSVLADDASLVHALGNFVDASIFGRRIVVAGKPLRIRTAATFRYYYIFRNRLLLVRQYWRSDPSWAIKGLLADYRHLCIVTALAPGRRARLSSAFTGVREGFRGRSGKRQLL